MNDFEQHLRGALTERLDREGLRPAPLPAASRRAIRRRRASLLLTASSVVAAGVMGMAALGDRTYGVVYDRNMGVIAPPPRPDSGTNHDRVWDGEVGFELSRLDCRHGSVGDEDSDLNPDGSRCTASLFVVNESAQDLLVPQASHVLTAGGRRFPPWERGMNELVADYPGSPITTPIPPGGAAALLLVFEYPSSLQPESLEIHASEGSPGAVVALEHCTWSQYRGRVSGGCFTTDHSVEVGVRHPHRISGPRGGMALYYVCFDERQWEVVEPHPTAVSREGFAGQGFLTLESPQRAIFEDNSGTVLRLAPTEDNEENPGVCG